MEFFCHFGVMTNAFTVRYNVHFTIAASSLAAISTWSISVISICTNWVKSFTISSNFFPDDVIGSAPDVTWNSNWPTWKSFYSFPGGLLENPAGLHGKPCLNHWSWMDLIRWNFNNCWYMNWDLRRWSRCSCQRRCCYSNPWNNNKVCIIILVFFLSF